MSKQPELPDRQLPHLVVGGHFPASDIRATPSFNSASIWLASYEKTKDTFKVSSALTQFIDNAHGTWKNKKPADTSIKTYESAVALTKKWEKDTIESPGVRIAASYSFKLAHALAAHTGILPLNHPDFTDTLEEMSETFIDYTDHLAEHPGMKKKEMAAIHLDPTSSSVNRALLFGDQAWRSMEQHGNVARIFRRLNAIAIRGFKMNTPEQKSLSRAGMGLAYTLSVHSRLYEPLDSLTGIQRPQKGASHFDPKTDSEIFVINGETIDNIDYPEK